MKHYYVDLHIHIGRTRSGKPVKITGAKSLTLGNILKNATEVKGLHMIGIIDCHVPEVLAELEEKISNGEIEEHDEGGLWFDGGCLILGSEIEIYDEKCNGPIHLLAFLPTVAKMKQFSTWMSGHMKNVTLSSQRLYVDGDKLQGVVKELGGLFIPAHVFTPHKSLYGRGVKATLNEVFNPELIDGIELGLSSNTEMADQIPELHQYTFISNSDAHSVEKIAREYQIVQMEKPTFNELKLALHNQADRRVVSNYGLDPRLGKYHRTSCEKCYEIVGDVTLKICPKCGHKRITKGVWDRLQELKRETINKPERPPYIHQVPLEFIPKLGPKTLDKLREFFKTDMAIIHEVPEAELRNVVSDEIADRILQSRKGEMKVQTGGAGRYGRII
jgi:uncharacterized protein (TIGR00375 family)